MRATALVDTLPRRAAAEKLPASTTVMKLRMHANSSMGHAFDARLQLAARAGASWPGARTWRKRGVGRSSLGRGEVGREALGEAQFERVQRQGHQAVIPKDA